MTRLGELESMLPLAGRLSRQVYETLKDRLLSGDLAAGSAVSVESVRSELGVSKQPVMEAARLLAADGLLEITPQVGIAVSKYSVEETADFFRIFARVEGSIAEIAGERAAPHSVAQLRMQARSMHSFGALGSPRERAAAYRLGNRAFHLMIHEMAQSPLMVATSRRLWDLSDFLIATSGAPNAMAGVLDARNCQHDEIVEALSRHDPAGARDAMERHILDVVAVLSLEL
jgi:DNA-binding GntR family transcriptional regulator